MILHLGFDVCVETNNGHKTHCTIVQESGMESKPKKVIGRPRRAQLDQAWIPDPLGRQPRPTKGMLVAIIVMNRTLVSNGRSAMWSTARATCCTSITASTAREPCACGTPRVITAAISVKALPMSICPQAMSYFLPSKAVDLVRPVMACLVAV